MAIEKPRTLTKRMIQLLIECRRMETDSKSNLCTQEYFSYSLPGLYKRGLVDLKRSVNNNKEVLMVYITEAGHKYLESLEKQEKYKPLFESVESSVI